MSRSKFRISLFFLCMFSLIHADCGADNAPAKDDIVHIGVLARRGSDRAVREWTPTARYLSSQIKDFQFDIVPLSFEEIFPAVQSGKVSFIIANSSVYVEMQVLYGVSRMATLKAAEHGGNSSVFGGVIFCRSERADLSTIQRLKGKSFMGVDEASLGGWQMAWRELKESGLDPYRDFSKLSFAGTHDQVVYSVMYGKVDAGTVATTILEQMIKEGKIAPGTFKVINPLTHDDFPFLHSTRLYPEWPFAKLKNTPYSLAEKVAVALMSMPADSEAALAANCSGWTVAHDYGSVDECLKVLRVGIYKDYGKLSTAAVLRQYQWQILSAVATIFVLAWFLVMALRLNKGLQLSKLALQQEVIQRKEAEETARRIGDQKDLILSSAGEGIFGLDQQGNVTFVNPAAARMVGRDPAELIGRPHHELVHHTKSDGSAYPREECPIYSVLMNGSFSSGSEEVFFRKDGTGFPVEFLSSPMYEQGKLTGAVVTFRDISERKQGEMELLRAKMQWERTFDSVPDLIAILDARHRIVRVNLAMAQRLGITQEQCVGLQCFEVVHGLHQPPGWCPFTLMLNDGHEHVTEWHEERLGGYFAVSVTPLRDEQGVLIGSVHVARDITERKTAENALKTRDEIYSAILRQAGDGILLFDTETLRFIEFNDAACQNLGYSREEFSRLTVLDVQGILTADEVVERVKMVIENGSSSFENRHRRKDGTLRDALVSNNVVIINGRTCIVCVWHDITERKETDRTLRNRERYFRSLIEHGQDIITVLEADGTVRYESPSVEQVLGYKPEELVGRSAFDLIHPEDVSDVVNIFRRGLQRPGTVELAEFRYKRKDGSWHVMEGVGTNLLHDSAVAGVVINSRDITERKHLEKQVRQTQKMEALGTLAGGIAHDFNNILAIIMGYGEMALMAGPECSSVRANLQNMLKATLRAKDLVKQILAFSRQSEQGRKAMRVGSVVKEALKLIRASTPTTIEIRQDLAADGTVMADPTAINQIIMNLCTNANHAMNGKGGILNPSLSQLE